MTTNHGSADEALLLASQRAYYDERADDYGDTDRPDRAQANFLPQHIAAELIDQACLTGDVLELACGPGSFTSELLRHAVAVTAVDASPRMLARARQHVRDPRVTFVLGDIFDWQPACRYDGVFFGHWLSHVPDSRFEEFWGLVDACLEPFGRVAFVDETELATDFESAGFPSGAETARRTLRDGRQFDIVKIFYRPDALQARLRSCGWDFDIRPVGRASMLAVGSRAEH